MTIWSLRERKIVARCQGHNSWVSTVAFDPWRCDERTYRFGSVGDDCRLLLWDFSVGMLHRPRAVRSLCPQNIVEYSQKAQLADIYQTAPSQRSPTHQFSRTPTTHQSPPGRQRRQPDTVRFPTNGGHRRRLRSRRPASCGTQSTDRPIAPDHGMPAFHSLSESPEQNLTKHINSPKSWARTRSAG